MENNTINLGGSVVGEYVVEVIRKDGTVRRPFGDTPQKNLILDTFFDAIMRDNYRFSAIAFIQSCRIGGGNGSDTPPERTQTGLQGSQVYISHIGDIMTAEVDNARSALVLARDFKFDINTSANPVVCREAVVGCFNASSTTALTGSDITLSRFVFPTDVIINNGEQLRINYTLYIVLDYLTRNVPITLQSGNTNFTGYIRMASDLTGLYGFISGSTVNIFVADDSRYWYRNFQTATTNVYTTDPTGAAAIWSHIFGVHPQGLLVGFFPTNHTPVTYSTARTTYTASGVLGSSTKYNYIKTNSGASIDVSYYIPAQTTSRSVNGVYLWYTSSGTSKTSLYLRFTESDFTTLRTQTINAGEPSGFKIRYFFNR